MGPVYFEMSVGVQFHTGDSLVHAFPTKTTLVVAADPPAFNHADPPAFETH